MLSMNASPSICPCQGRGDLTAFTLRIAELDDEAAVTALTQASYSALMPAAYDQDLLSKVLPIIARANPKLLASGSYYVAVSADGAIIGAGGWTRERPGSGAIEEGRGHIRHFAIHPDWIGRGVGRALVERAVREAESHSIRRLECNSSLNAVDFYRRLGFINVRAIDVPLGEHLRMPAMLMERNL